jgi:alpha-L-fucosidase 2
MLLQSRIQPEEKESQITGFKFEIDLLPALPQAWPTGKVAGLRARGGFEVDIAWKDGRCTTYRVASSDSRKVSVRVNGETKVIQSEKNHRRREVIQ